MAEMTKRAGGIWQQRIDDARKFRQEKLTNDVKRHLDLYRGRQWGGLSTPWNRDLITVNMVFPLIRNQIGSYYYRNPKLHVFPRNDKSEVNAYLSQEILNYFWGEVDVQKQMRFMLYDVHIFNHAVAEIGWRFMTDIVKVHGKERIEYHEFIREDKPYVRRISPLRFLVDPKSGMEPIINSEWVGKEFFRSLMDVKRDPKYKNTKDLEANTQGNEEESARYGESMVKLVEVHDRKNNELLVMTEGQDRPLMQMKHPYGYLEGHNFEWLQFNHIPDETYGISQIALLEDQQHELNRTRTQMFQHRRRVSNRRYIFDEGAVSDLAQTKLEDAEGGALVGISNIDRIKPLEDARLSYDVPLIESIIKQDLRELTGLPAAQMGVMDTQSRSATEHIQMQQALQARISDNAILVEEFVRNCARKFLQVIQKNLDQPLAVKIVGVAGEMWENPSKEDIQGEYDVRIDPGSMTPRSDELEKKQALDLLNILLRIPGMNVRRAVTDVLKAYGRPRVEEYFTEKFDQMFGNGQAPLAPNNQGQAPPSEPGQILQQGEPDLTALLSNLRQVGAPS